MSHREASFLYSFVRRLDGVLVRYDDTHSAKGKASRAFTLLEILVAFLIIGVILAILLPAIQTARESARQLACQGNLRQTALALHNYHSAHGHLPMHGGGTRTEINPPLGSGGNELGNHFTLSFLVGVLPFIEQQALWEQISNPMVASQEFNSRGFSWPPMGPFPTEKNYAPWATEIVTYHCPSQPDPLSRGGTNYAACLGDSVDQTEWGDWNYHFESRQWRSDRMVRVNTSCRGLWVMRRFCRFSSVKDGLSNTIMVGEICRELGLRSIATEPALWNGEAPDGTWTSAITCEKHVDPDQPKSWKPLTRTRSPGAASRGASYGLAWPVTTSFNTINAPNGPICLSMHIQSPGHLPPSSYHAGGFNAVMADGSTRFVTESIDAGDLQSPTVYWTSERTLSSVKSPYGVWGAMGTRAAAD